ncbi:MAG: hypothetical protein KDD89_15590, partial [Anaerolineales bacterium]|nr:hypothetical protein [Anaerolineales bacterium]
WWYYFPVALAVKTPLPTLILAALGVWPLVRQQAWRRTVVVWGPLLLYLALAMSGRITIGYRHILPVVPFLILLAGYATQLPVAQKRLAQAGLAVLLGWQAIAMLWLFPHQEAFFNELVGGPGRGGAVLSDSNLDWGQDLPALKQLLAERGIDEQEVYLAYFGTAVPEAYGLRYKPLPGFIRFTAGAEVDAFNPYTPPPGWYAISESSLRLGLMMQNNDLYAFFAAQEPVARAGYSINLYEVRYPAEWPVRRTAVSGTAVSDLSPEALGMEPQSRTIVKWTASDRAQIFPAGSFVPPDEMVRVGDGHTAVFGDGAFGLHGYSLRQNGSELVLTLYWQVGNTAVETPKPTSGAPLAAFVHLSDEADPSRIVAQYDGWETALTGLEAGDMIAHTVALMPPSDAPPGEYMVRVG